MNTTDAAPDAPTSPRPVRPAADETLSPSPAANPNPLLEQLLSWPGAE